MRCSLKFQKICRCHALGMLHVQAQKIFIPGQDDVYVCNNGCIQNRLIFRIADQFFCMVNCGDQFIRQFRQQNFRIRQIFWSLSSQDIPNLHNVSVT